MWSKSFEYTRVASVQEAINIVAQNSNAKILAGGHSLLPALKLRLNESALLVDIGRVNGLKGITANGVLKIGSLTTHDEVAASAAVRSTAPALAQAAGKIGDQAVRNFGTIGGNIAHADPASDPPTVLTAYDATIHLHGTGGARTVKAGDFFIDLFSTDLKADELVTAVEIAGVSGAKSAYVKLSHPASRYAVVGVCVVLQVSGGVCQSARVAVGGATVKAVRSPGAEAALTGSTLNSSALDAAANAITGDITDYLTGDMTFPQDYRQAMTGIYLRRAVQQALA